MKPHLKLVFVAVFIYITEGSLLVVCAKTLSKNSSQKKVSKKTHRKTLAGKLSPILVKSQRSTLSDPAKDPSAFSETIDTEPEVARIKTLGELLRERAGVQIRTAGGLGSWTSISIRGSSPSQVDVIIDGIPLNNGGNAAVDLGDIPIEPFSEITLYRGFSPLHLGGNLGGVLELKTKAAKSIDTWSATLASGSFRTVKVNGFLSQSRKQIAFSLFAQYLTSSGEFEYYDDRGTPYQLADDLPNALRKNNWSNSASLLGRLSWKPRPYLSLNLSSLLISSARGVPGIGNFRSKTAKYGQTRYLLSLLGRGNFAGKIPANWKLRPFLLLRWENFFDPRGEIGLARQNSSYSTTVFGLETLFRWLPLPWLELTIASELKAELFSEQDQIDPEKKTPAQRSRWQWTPSIQLITPLFGERLILLGGLRFLLIDNRYLRSIFIHPQFSGTPPSAFYPNGRFGVRFELYRWLQIQSNLGYYTRLPTFWELFGDRGTSVGNPTLRPEQGFSADFGFSIKRTLPSLRIQLYSAVFTVQARDLIRYIQNSQRTMIPVNIGSASIFGLESSLRTLLFQYFRLSFDLTLMKANNTSELAFERGKQLPGRPLWQLSARAEFLSKPLRVFYSLFAQGNNFLDRGNLRELASRSFHNIGLTILLGELLKTFGLAVPWGGPEINFEIKNLFDLRVVEVPLRPPLGSLDKIPQAVSDFSGYPLPGRSFFLSVRWKN